MDILIKNNIIKKTKLIVDIGMFATEVLEAHYAAKKITVTDSTFFENKGIVEDEIINFTELAKKIDAEVSSSGRSDVTVALPADICENKIITIKNKKESEIPKIIKKDYMTFGRANPLTHVVDYAFLGKREEQGDTVFYYLISAVQKSIASDLITAFSKYKLKVKTVVSSVYTQICLSELFFDEYEHLNRLMIDFGMNSSRITAFSEGIAVYTRVIDYGFESYVNKLFSSNDTAGKPAILEALINVGEFGDLPEDVLVEYFSELDAETYRRCISEVDDEIIRDISRVIDLCSNNDVSITKVYSTGFTLKGFSDKLADSLDLAVDNVAFRSLEEKEGKGYILEIDEVYLGREFSNALGLCVYPML